MAKKTSAPTKSQIVATIADQTDLPKKQIEAMYLSILARKPAPEEKTKALAELQASGELAGAQNIVWALLNSMEFMFVQ